MLAKCLPNPLLPASIMTLSSRHKCATSGFTLAEVICAAAILVLFVTAIFAVNQKVLASLRAQKETLAATQIFQERIEQLRYTAVSDIAGTNFADINWLKANIYNADTQSISTLGPSAAETVVLSVYPAPVGTAAQLTRTNGTVNTDSTGDPSIPSATLVRADLQLTWTSSSGRSRSEERRVGKEC